MKRHRPTQKFQAAHASQASRQRYQKARESGIDAKMTRGQRQLDELAYLKSVKPNAPRMPKTPRTLKSRN